MSKKGASKNDLKGLTYVAQKPAFLTNFGQPQPDPSSSSSRRGGGDGREPLPSRPRDGEWAGGSDEEKEKQLGSDDEWGDVYGGGGDEGPQVVVLKEGRHLSADEVKRERRRAAGKPSQSPEPESKKKDTDKDQPTKKVSQLPPKLQSSAKRKLVTKDTDKNVEGENGDAGKKDGAGGKRKKKSDKKLLSFNEDE